MLNSCGLEDFGSVLKYDALNQQEDKLNVTYIVMYNQEIIGRFSLLSDMIKLENIGSEYNVSI